jgi:hypothetical protein
MGNKNLDKIAIDYPQDTGVELGQGWDRKTSQKKNAVGVEFTPAIAMPGQTKDMKIVKVSDQSSLMASVGISAEAQYKNVANNVKGRVDFSLNLKTVGIYQSFASWAKVENGLLYTAPKPKDKAGEKGKTTSEMLKSLEIHTLQKNPKEYAADKSVRLTEEACKLAKEDINEGSSLFYVGKSNSSFPVLR